MLPRVNVDGGIMDRLYISEYEITNKKLMLVYRPTHEFIGMFTPKQIIALWQSSCEQFYKYVMKNSYFRLPRNGTFDFMPERGYENAESAYERIYLPTTEKFRKKYKLKPLREAIPYDFIKYIKSERRTVCGQYLSCEFNETENIRLFGEYAWWAEELFDKIQSFEGHTKVELFLWLREYVGVDLFIDVLQTFKKHGIYGIAELKKVTRKELAKMFVTQINYWK